MFAKKHGVAIDEVPWQANEGQLAVDVIETPDRIMIRSAIAGVHEDDLQIHVNEDMVTIRGERQVDHLPLNATVHYEECFWGVFSRSIILPCRVKPDEADASLRNGVLLITIPKARGEVAVPVRREHEL
ncbi:MAG: Hsp20/alpha crystallin family protein [Candidatus Uhrbacteria bacterium]|nr:Hsp20/alpha crystallin family protein [Candidatus Uhrbacteria bacterium]